MQINLKELGWDKEVLGDVDHTKMRAPHIRLAYYNIGRNKDVVYVYELRMVQPNYSYLKSKVVHSFEHFLLAGFRQNLKDNFICVAPMGCQTGFYLTLLNEGRAEVIFDIYERILRDIIVAKQVPYNTINECGQYLHHSLDVSVTLAKYLLSQKSVWGRVFGK